MSSNLASVKVVDEDDDAKVANISKDVASVASQMISSGSDLTTASAVKQRDHRILASLRLSSWKSSKQSSV